MAGRLERGEHLLLYGPRGGGKTTLLQALERRFADSGIPCAYAASSASLDAITRALAGAYPGVDSRSLTRRQARSRLRLAAEGRRGVLLLDHARAVNTQMVGFLRRLRGGVAGVLLAADADSERDVRRMRQWHLGASPVRMPPASVGRLRRALRNGCDGAGMTDAVAPWERQILRAARGRIGWIVACARLIGQPRYWDGATLHASVLCTDAEIALREPAVAADLLENAKGAGSA